MPFDPDKPPLGLTLGVFGVMGVGALVMVGCCMGISSCNDSQNKQSSSPTGKGPLEIGRTYRIKVSCFGGVSEAALDKWYDLAKAKDEEAIGKLLFSGQGEILSPGTKVTVEAVSIWGKSKVRPEGEVKSLWIFHEWAD